MSSKDEIIPEDSGFPDTPSQGDIVYYNGSVWTSLAAGSAGQVLMTQGAAANPVWTAGVPIGSMMPWVKTLTGVPALPAGWVECDGTVLSDSDSPMDGETLPPANSANLFLRGNSTSGGTGGAATNVINKITNAATTGGATVLTGIDGSANSPFVNEPPYYDVVWIIKVKH